MKLYPAIDLRGGQAVRLYQGDYDRMTVYNADPVAQAQQFIDAGAKYLHVVDLDGAKDDTTANLQTIAAIAKLGGLKIEVGGGIRDEARIQRYLDLGADRCILGTVAVKNFDFTAEMAQKYGAQIAVGIDMKDGAVAVNGWKEVPPEPGVAFCRRCANCVFGAVHRQHTPEFGLTLDYILFHSITLVLAILCKEGTLGVSGYFALARSRITSAMRLRASATDIALALRSISNSFSLSESNSSIMADKVSADKSFSSKIRAALRFTSAIALWNW